MIKAIILFLFLFTIGNVVAVPVGEPKLFYVPLSVALFLMVKYIYDTARNISRVQRILLTYFLALSVSNIVKQVFYNEKLKQINDYVVGSIASVILIIAIAWEIRRTKKHGKK